MNQTAERPSQELILALSKGRIFEETMPLLEAAGITVLEDPETSRKLILPTNKPQVRVIIVRATDVPTPGCISRLICKSRDAGFPSQSKKILITKRPSGKAPA